MKPCIFNPDLSATCNDCYFNVEWLNYMAKLGNGCDGTEEPAICDICGAVIINANLLIEHKNINHK